MRITAADAIKFKLVERVESRARYFTCIRAYREISFAVTLTHNSITYENDKRLHLSGPATQEQRVVKVRVEHVVATLVKRRHVRDHALCAAVVLASRCAVVAAAPTSLVVRPVVQLLRDSVEIKATILGNVLANERVLVVATELAEQLAALVVRVVVQVDVNSAVASARPGNVGPPVENSTEPDSERQAFVVLFGDLERVLNLVVLDVVDTELLLDCLLYTSPSPRDS